MDNKNSFFFRQKLEAQRDELLPRIEGNVFGSVQGRADIFDSLGRVYYDSDQSVKVRVKNREKRFLDKIQNALVKIEDGSYGICEVCGEAISTKRLEARPVTTKCIHCKEKEEKMEWFCR